MLKNWPSIKLGLVLVIVVISTLTMGLSVPIVHGQLIEKSVNLSRVSGTGRKIRMYIKDKYLQLFDNGIVNATDDENSDYTILQRTSIHTGQVKIQGVATSFFLCIDSCGLLYSTRDFCDECVFNELLEKHYYNTYSSIKYSDANRTSYVAISKKGTPRKVEIMANSKLGKFSSYVEVLPQPVEPERVQQLEEKLSSMHHIRHHHNRRITGSAKCVAKIERKKSSKYENTLDYRNSPKKLKKSRKSKHGMSKEIATTDLPEINTNEDGGN